MRGRWLYDLSSWTQDMLADILGNMDGTEDASMYAWRGWLHMVMGAYNSDTWGLPTTP